MTNTPYNQLRQLLTDRMVNSIDTVLMTQVEWNKLIPREYNLQDILLAVSTVGGVEVSPQINKTLCFRNRFSETDNDFFYDLTKNLAEQSDETLLALIEIIK